MPPRIGANGAIVKPCSSTSKQRNERPSARKVIDLTREHSDESPGKTSGGTSVEGDEIEDAPEPQRGRSNEERRHTNSKAGRHERVSGAGQGKISQPGRNDHQRIARRSPEDVLENSYVVTSLHHTPWGAGDDTTTVGVFLDEEEAKVAAYMDFQKFEQRADGWEFEWCLAGDGMLQLRAIIEEGEDDSERYTASIKLVQQKRPVPVQPRVQSGAEPKTRLVKPHFVYVVKEEQRTNVGEYDTQGLHDECSDLKAVHIHGIYSDLDAANDFVREIYDTILDSLGRAAETVSDTTENNMAMILVENSEDSSTYSLTVEERSLC